ncbi:MAG: hypothetical protein Q8M76_00570 [Spirochaetaceae bacterium]|nr:hypothetical protein [Spirochaetaceae bacterium]
MLAVRRLSSRFVLVLALSCFILPEVQAEVLWSDSGFYVDMPSGFELADGDGKARFAFVDPNGAMEFDIFVYDYGRYASADAIAADIAKKLGSEGEREAFSYEGRQAVLSELSFSLDGEKKRGYAIFVGGRTGGSVREKSYALLAYSPEADFEGYADFVMSCLDAFSVDLAATRRPGAVSQYLLSWPAEQPATKKVSIPGGAQVELPWSDAEADEEAGVIGREYRVLASYAGTADLWIDAWARFYRMAYRESAARLDRLALELSRTLPLSDPTDTARRLLAWVQSFVYERNPEGADFVPAMAAAYEGRGDCDSRAMVMAAILERFGVDAILMVSSEYSHAMIAVDVPGGGQRFEFGGKSYLVGETTADVGIGMIAANQADWSKWMGIQLGD